MSSGYACCRFASGGLIGARPIGNTTHLVRATGTGTPGPTLCGIDRFAKDTPGWSIHEYRNGNPFDPHSGRPIEVCDLCEAEKARRETSAEGIPNYPQGGA